MEDSDVGQQVTLTPEVVRQRLRNLENLLEELDAVITALAGVRRRQGPAMWSTVGACQAFTVRTSDAMDNLHGWLAHDRSEIGRLREALEATWRTLGAVDQDIEDRLVALADKIDAGLPPGPLVCTPYDDPDAVSQTPAAAPAPAPTPTPSPTPAPAPTPAPSGGGGSW